MEILLKTKQSGNDKFNFLDFGNELNDYYKFLKQAIKDKKFIPAETKDEVASESDSDSDTDSEGNDIQKKFNDCVCIKTIIMLSVDFCKISV